MDRKRAIKTLSGFELLFEKIVTFLADILLNTFNKNYRGKKKISQIFKENFKKNQSKTDEIFLLAENTFLNFTIKNPNELDKNLSVELYQNSTIEEVILFLEDVRAGRVEFQ